MMHVLIITVNAILVLMITGQATHPNGRITEIDSSLIEAAGGDIDAVMLGAV